MSKQKILIKVILGSTRPGRFGDQPAQWIMNLAKEYPEATFELVDLQKVNLPFLDEPVPALFGQYSKEHSKAWSKTIGEADGFIFVTPEYNSGVPASFKNAVDFLAAEWRYKPVAFVSYGAGGGGILAVNNWRSIFAYLGIFGLSDHVLFIEYYKHLDKDGKLIPSEEQIAGGHKLLKNIAFWSEKLKPIRQELTTTNNTYPA
ncbi:MAG: NAD(P)H-dependent oxidoreductase [Patescibacteria group bacterium]